MKLPRLLLLAISLLAFSSRLVAVETAEEIITRINAAMQKRVGTKIDFPKGTLTAASLTASTLKLEIKEEGGNGESLVVVYSKIDWRAAEYCRVRSELHYVYVRFAEGKGPFITGYGPDGLSSHLHLYVPDEYLEDVKADGEQLRVGPGPSEKQTLEYIQARLPALMSPRFARFSSADDESLKVCIAFRGEPDDPNATPIKFVRIPWKEVSGISVAPNPEANTSTSALRIFFTGAFRDDGNDVKQAQLFVRDDKDGVDRFVKALKRMCKFSGAKLVDNELF